MTTSVVLPHNAHGAASQSTVIEGNRVAAEVYAAILVAQQVPRDMVAVQEEMEQMCRTRAMAKKAIYKRPVGGGKTATGPTIHLMKELARIWGNTQWGMAELSRGSGKSELLAYAWDAQKNSRSSRIIVVEHKRDKTDTGPEEITDMGSIMTNNTSVASRHLRETIATILPGWFVDRAVELCMQTLTGGDSVPMPQKIRNAVAKFEELGVRRDRLVTKLDGRPTNEWDVLDLAALLESYSRISSGESTIEVEFPVPVMKIPAFQLTNQDDPEEPTEAEAEVRDASVDSFTVDTLPDDRAELLQVVYDLFRSAGIGSEGTQRSKRLRIITRALTAPAPVKAVTELSDEQVRQIAAFMIRQREAGELISVLEEMASESPSEDEM